MLKFCDKWYEQCSSFAGMSRLYILGHQGVEVLIWIASNDTFSRCIVYAIKSQVWANFLFSLLFSVLLLLYVLHLKDNKRSLLICQIHAIKSQVWTVERLKDFTNLRSTSLVLWMFQHGLMFVAPECDKFASVGSMQIVSKCLIIKAFSCMFCCWSSKWGYRCILHAIESQVWAIASFDGGVRVGHLLELHK